MPRGITYVGSAQAVGIGSRPSAVDLGASILNLPGYDVKVSSQSAAFHPGVPGEQSKQGLQGMSGHTQNTRTREQAAKDLLPLELGLGHGNCHASSVWSLTSFRTEEINSTNQKFTLICNFEGIVRCKCWSLH